MLRPSTTQVVAYALTEGDPAPVEAALGAALGKRLCLAHSHYSVKEVAAAVARFPLLSPQLRAAGAYGVVHALTQQGQISIGVDLVNVTAAVASRAAAAPAGLVTLNPWLTPG